MTTAPTTQPTRPRTTHPRRTPLFIHIAAWSVPTLVLTQFSMVAIVPVAVLLIGSVVSPRARALRWWAGALAAAYATPLAIWALREDGAQSLSKDMHPALGGLIVAVSVAFLIRIYTRRNR
ncbi:hypothetical protein [Labedella endophytica]|uniref:Uncharacterized protein n=1 Tax=Labedella endophytica TaxID=1523160 RepID=A0A433JVA3_9MICO|nr:hypothetical protein [Labedella endophytica]RUR03102.1 hypothetical protein ELQ94_00645 [Labedella endophytica]